MNADGSTEGTKSEGRKNEGTNIGDRAVDFWTGLDRGWQALLLGLGIVAVHLVVQVL